MNSGKTSSRRVAIAASLLLAALAWPTEIFAAQITATWLDSSVDEVGFAVERSTGTTGAFVEVGETGSGVTTYVDADVVDGTTYCYRVRAFNTTAYSEYSNTACGATAQAVGLTVFRMGAGSGTVISEPSGIVCGSSCSGTFASGTAVTLTATAATGYTFTGWSGGGCAGTGSCTVTLTAATTVTATFEPSPGVSLTVSKAGTGSGTVSSTPAGIVCGATCTASYPYGTAVSLTAVVPAGSTFTGWSGGCTGTGPCTLTLTAATTVTATFTLQAVALTVGKAGTGGGTVSSAPSGIDCGAACTASYPYGSAVSLAATAPSGSTFAGWSGACSGTGACSVTLTSATTVTATFTQQSQAYTLTVGVAGKGTVTSSPAGILCGKTCAASYPGGATVTLTAAAGAGFAFSGWSGACAGAGDCTVSMTAAQSVTATFKNVPRKR